MKLMYGNVPVKSMNIHHFEMDTNDCDMIASDLQAGKTAVAKGKKITGTGKSFEFAHYGVIKTNTPQFIPTLINVVEISGIDYPTRSLINLLDISNIDFTTEQTIGIVVADDIEYPITIKVEGSIFAFNCEKKVTLNFFYGKDNYI